MRGDCSPSRSVVSKTRADLISSVESNVPWKNSTPLAGARGRIHGRVVGHGVCYSVPSAYIKLSLRQLRDSRRGDPPTGEIRETDGRKRPNTSPMQLYSLYAVRSRSVAGCSRRGRIEGVTAKEVLARRIAGSPSWSGGLSRPPATGGARGASGGADASTGTVRGTRRFAGVAAARSPRVRASEGR